jgi:hypothetical protein
MGRRRALSASVGTDVGWDGWIDAGVYKWLTWFLFLPAHCPQINEKKVYKSKNRVWACRWVDFLSHHASKKLRLQLLSTCGDN